MNAGRFVVVAMGASVLLAGCASGPRPAGTPPGASAMPSPPPSPPPRNVERDGLEPNPPPVDLTRVPDAEPQLEPIRSGGPNKPYEVAGRTYTPIAEDRPFTETGLASWYGRKFHGRRTASGEVYNMYTMTAAHPTLPIPSYARIRNPANGREVVVRVNDRGPFVKGRIVDLSYAAALRIGVQNGVAPVELQRITFDEIRTGAWRREGGATAVAAAATPVPAPATVPAPVPVPAEAVVPVVARPAEDAAASAPAVPAAPVADAPSSRAFTGPQRGFWVQLGAFKAREGAEAFQRRVAADADWLSPLLAVFPEAAIFKLQAGPYPGKDEARAGAERIRTVLQLVPVIVERK